MAAVDTSTYGMYSLYDLQKETPAQRGGKNRAATATRSPKGVFMPNDFVAQLEWEDDPNHGSMAGQANVQTCVRSRGKFARKGGQS